MRCCWPPDNCEGSFASTPGRRTMSSARFTLRADVGLGHAAIFEAEGDVLANRLVREEGVVLEHQADIALVDRHIVDAPPGDDDLARCRADEAGDRAQDRRLAAARRPEQGHEAALVDREIDIVHGDERPIGERDAPQIDGGLSHARHPPRATLADGNFTQGAPNIRSPHRPHALIQGVPAFAGMTGIGMYRGIQRAA